MKACPVANYMLYLMSDEVHDLTNMKINKLLYFAQGHYLAMYGEPLFREPVEAWPFGPVVESVYENYKAYSNAPIRHYDYEAAALFAPKHPDFFVNLAVTYGKCTAARLLKETHKKGGPWDRVYRSSEAHAEIPQTMIQEYFKRLGPLKPPERRYKESDFIGYRNADGVLVLPREWDC